MYIVGKRTASGQITMATSPMLHKVYEDAVEEAMRLAGKIPGTYVVFEAIMEAYSLPNPVAVRTLRETENTDALGEKWDNA